MSTYEQAYIYYDDREDIQASIKQILCGNTPGYYANGRNKKFRKLQDERNLCEIDIETERAMEKELAKALRNLITN